MDKSLAKSTRSQDNIWLIGFPIEKISGSRLPSGRDVMRNFVYHHRIQKRTLDDSASLVLEQLLPFWSKSRLPTRDRQHILRKVKLLFNEQTDLMKHRSRSNDRDLVNQKSYSDKLDGIFDISHANAEQLITNEEDRQFLRLQRESRTGCIGSVDKILAGKEDRAAERRQRFMRLKLQAVASEGSQQDIMSSEYDSDSSSLPSSDDLDDDPEAFVAKQTRPTLKRAKLIDASETVKTFIHDNYQKDYPREDYKEFLHLAALMIGLDVKLTIRKPGALHRARWMAKAIYSMKIELLWRSNEGI